VNGAVDGYRKRGEMGSSCCKLGCLYAAGVTELVVSRAAECAARKAKYKEIQGLDPAAPLLFSLFFFHDLSLFLSFLWALRLILSDIL
jgi:hypothetical protein